MITRLTLPNDQWIDVKTKRNVQDVEDVNAYASEGMSSDGKTVRFSVVKHNVAMAAVYIKNWSDNLLDEDGIAVKFPTGKVPFKDRTAAIKRLDADQFEAISNAIDSHVKEVKGEAEEGKDVIPLGVTSSGSDSPSAN